MRNSVFIFLFFVVSNLFSQNEIYFYKDSVNIQTIETIKNVEFKKLEKTISDGYNKTSYWFRVSNMNTSNTFYFTATNPQIQHIVAFKNGIKINKAANHRFSSIKFIGDSEIYVKITPRKESFIPIDILAEKDFLYKERTNMLFNGLYYGIALIIVISYIFYSILLGDDSFLYYGLFVFSLTCGVFVRDGMLNFMEASISVIDFTVIFIFILIAFFASKFSDKYLQIDFYFPKIKFFSYGIGVIIIILGLCHLITGYYYLFLSLVILVFSLFLTYYIVGILLFNKNVFIKIYVLAYTFILFLAFNNYVLKTFGISFEALNAVNFKMGGIIEMVIFSSALIYRMKILKNDNKFMRDEIVKYSIKLKELSKIKLKKNTDGFDNHLETLSIREYEIFNLILRSKSNKEIANELNISVNTVKFHIKNIYEKLNIKSRKEALVIAKN
ncbi:LuxR C-terminal-related transcriptional regulator [Polaribacter sp.]|uniref:LuxR C-terminal-related transcriptional regulator n=1 Tax=Polaribacter sp. TaxID=1920175 RepID=UPI003F6C85BD